jgi:hypothetical protein
MKKFSKTINQKIGKEPNQYKEYKEEDILKSVISNMIDNDLNIEFYGPTNRYFEQGDTKIIGKDIFIENIINLFKKTSSKKEVKLLESLKSDIKDWKLIDKKIISINENLVSDDVQNDIKIISDIIDRSDVIGDVKIRINKIASKINNPIDASNKLQASIQLYKLKKYDINIIEDIILIFDKKFTDLTKWVHPEQKEDEIFFINVFNGKNFNSPDFAKSSRLGDVAYTTGGKEVVPNARPMFITLKD